jgi:hypothetical protein
MRLLWRIGGTLLGGLPWAAVARLSIRVLAPLALLVAIVFALRSRFGPLPRVSSYVYWGILLAVYLVTVWRSRQGGTKPSGGVFKAVAYYLFGKW